MAKKTRKEAYFIEQVIVKRLNNGALKDGFSDLDKAQKYLKQLPDEPGVRYRIVRDVEICTKFTETVK